MYLIEIRMKLGLSQKELAKKLGVSQSRVAGWENGKIPQPGAKKILADKLQPEFGEIEFGKPTVVESYSSGRKRLILQLIEELGEEEALRRLLQNFGEKSKDFS